MIELTLALFAGGALFLIAAITGEKNALFIPAIILFGAAALNAFGAPLL